MKTKTIIVAACISLTLALASCNNADAPKSSASDQTTTTLGKTIQNIVGTSGNKDDSYILYDASSDSLITLTADEYALGNALAILIVKDNESISKSHEEQGWKLCGTGKNEFDAQKIANSITKQMPAKKNYEIRIKYKDGQYTVYTLLV